MIDIRKNIVNMLDANGQPDQFRLYSTGQLLLLVQLRMRVLVAG